MNEVRFLLDSGAGTDGALRALVDLGRYDAPQVPSDIHLLMVDELLRHGARDTPDDTGRTALDSAEWWLTRRTYPGYEAVVERLRAAGAGQ